LRPFAPFEYTLLIKKNISRLQSERGKKRSTQYLKFLHTHTKASIFVLV